jgi:hypothetical protein
MKQYKVISKDKSKKTVVFTVTVNNMPETMAELKTAFDQLGEVDQIKCFDCFQSGFDALIKNKLADGEELDFSKVFDATSRITQDGMLQALHKLAANIGNIITEMSGDAELISKHAAQIPAIMKLQQRVVDQSETVRKEFKGKLEEYKQTLTNLRSEYKEWRQTIFADVDQIDEDEE